MKLSDLLLPFQKRFVNDLARFLIAVWSRQTGKGYTTGYIATKEAMSAPRNNWIIAAPTERQAMETLDKCKDWARKANILLSESEEELEALEKDTKIKAKVIVFPNGSKIYGLPGRPASLRGFRARLSLTNSPSSRTRPKFGKPSTPLSLTPCLTSSALSLPLPRTARAICSTVSAAIISSNRRKVVSSAGRSIA